MAEETSTEAAPQEAAETVVEASDEVAKWKAEARKWEKRSKENASAAEELAKLKESQLSEVEKAQNRAAKAEKELEGYKAAAQRAEWNASVAKSTGLPVDMVALIEANTEDELAERANEVKSLIEPEHKETVPVVLGAGQAPKTPEKAGGDWVRKALEKR